MWYQAVQRVVLLVSVAGLTRGLHAAEPPRRPNIVWIFVDDMSANFSCYGETAIETPHVDRLAREGTQFQPRVRHRAGLFPLPLGLDHRLLPNHDRSASPPQRPRRRKNSSARAASSRCRCCSSAPGTTPPSAGRSRPEETAPGKTDYNFEWDRAMYDGSDWSDREDGTAVLHAVRIARRQTPRRGAQQYDAWAKRVFSELGSNVPPTR